MTKILVTGASGFLGRHLVPVLQAKGFTVFEAGRTLRNGAQRHVFIPAITAETDWSEALQGIDAVIHLAGVAHRKAPPEVFQAVNDAGTGRLVEASMKRGLRGFVLLSS